MIGECHVSFMYRPLRWAVNERLVIGEFQVLSLCYRPLRNNKLLLFADDIELIGKTEEELQSLLTIAGIRYSGRQSLLDVSYGCHPLYPPKICSKRGNIKQQE